MLSLFLPLHWGPALLLSNLMYVRLCMTMDDVITLNGNNCPSNKTPMTTGLAKRPYVVAGLQSQCFYPLHPKVRESSEEQPLFLWKSEAISGQNEFKGQTSWKKTHNTGGAVWWNTPKAGGCARWLLDEQNTMKALTIRECLFNLFMHVTPSKTDHSRGV